MAKNGTVVALTPAEVEMVNRILRALLTHPFDPVPPEFTLALHDWAVATDPKWRQYFEEQHG